MENKKGPENIHEIVFVQRAQMREEYGYNDDFIENEFRE